MYFARSNHPAGFYVYAYLRERDSINGKVMYYRSKYRVPCLSCAKHMGLISEIFHQSRMVNENRARTGSYKMENK